jgi:hypothetical protein
LNSKLVIGFIAGVLAATGVFYATSHRVSPAPVPPVTASAPGTAAIPLTPGAPVTAKPVSEVPQLRAVRRVTPKPASPPPPPVQEPGAAPSAPAAALPQDIPGHPRATPVPAPPVDSTPATADPPAAPPAPEVLEVFQPEQASRQPRTVTIANGTELYVSLGEALSSERHRTGDTFVATLDQPLVADDLVIAERGARVEGRVAEALAARRGGGQARLVLELTHVHTADNQRVEIRTDPYQREAERELKNTLTKVAVGAAIGAAIGAAAGGGKGAGIGAAAGGAAGTGAAVAMKGSPVTLPAEARLTFRLAAPVAITERL